LQLRQVAGCKQKAASSQQQAASKTVPSSQFSVAKLLSYQSAYTSHKAISIAGAQALRMTLHSTPHTQQQQQQQQLRFADFFTSSPVLPRCLFLVFC